MLIGGRYVNKRTFLKSAGALAISRLISSPVASPLEPTEATSAWSLNMDVLESCSCPVFCQCFFTGKPPATAEMHSGHSGMQHVCRFNQSFKVNSGHAGGVRLDEAKFWYTGDAGDDFGKPKLDWAVLTWDPGVSKEQREALLSTLRNLRWFRPDRWVSYAISDKDAAVDFQVSKTGVHAQLGDGRVAETRTTTMIGLEDKPVMMSNLRYFGFPRNTGFILMPSDVVAYREGDRAFEYKNTNGFLTTVDMNAHDFPPKSA